MVAEAGASLRLTVDATEVTLQPGRPPVPIDVRVANLSPIVDEIVVWASLDEGWLQASSHKFRVMPNTEGEAVIELAIPEHEFVIAGTRTIDVHARSSATGAVQRERVDITVPAMSGEMSLSLEPSVLRSAREGTVTVTLRNDGTAVTHLTLHATDPEGELQFAWSTSEVDVPPRGEAHADLQVSAPRAARSEDRHRTFAVEARGGERPLSATGQLIQPAVLPAGRVRAVRTAARLVTTVVGAILMLAGVLRPWNAGGAVGPQRHGLQWNYQRLADLVEPGAVAAIAGDQVMILLSAGALVIVLAVLVVVGLTGSSGRMSRRSGGLAVVLVMVFGVVLMISGGHGGPAGGVWLVGIGGVLSFVGGALAER